MSAIGLPAHYRFLVENKTGQTLAANAVKVYAKRDKFDSNGAISFEASEATLFDNGATIANNAFSAGSTVDNTTNKYLSGDFIYVVTAPASASGDVNLYVQRSTDGGTRWGDNATTATHLTTLNFTASGTKQRGFSWGGE